MTPNGSTADEYRRRICRAMDFIAQHLDENPPLEEIARAAPFSKFHFHRIFSALVGETVGEFTRRLRLERAANRLICHPDHDITGIAHGCGFSSSQNFAKAFRAHFDQSPSEFRKKRKRGNTHRKGGNAFSQEPWQGPHSTATLSSSSERSLSMKVEIKELSPVHVAYVRAIGPYGPEVCGGAFARLMQWAGPRGLIGQGLSIGISWDNPEVTPPDKCRYDACIPVPEGTKVSGEVTTQTVPGGAYALCRCEIGAEEFGKAWMDFMCEWLPSSGYEPDDRPCFELCHSDAQTHPEGKWVVDLCCPVRPL